MPIGKSRPIIVICGSVSETPKHLRQGGEPGGRPPLSIPITWIAGPERIRGMASAVGANDSDAEVVLHLPAAVLASGQRLRAVLARARESVPALSAIAVRGAGGLSHRQLLVEEGIRVVLVDSLGKDGRGSRRPAPIGWRCRNSSWGLWEVELSPPSCRGPFSFLGLGMRPRLRPGALGVFVTEGLDAKGLVHHRLERMVSWANRLVARDAAEIASLTSVVNRLAGDDQPALTGSVLRAA